MEFKRSRRGGREGRRSCKRVLCLWHSHTAGHCYPGLQKEPFSARSHQGVVTGRLEKLNLHFFGFYHKKTERREPQIHPQVRISSQSCAFSCHLGATHQHRAALERSLSPIWAPGAGESRGTSWGSTGRAEGCSGEARDGFYIAHSKARATTIHRAVVRK